MKQQPRPFTLMRRVAFTLALQLAMACSSAPEDQSATTGTQYIVGIDISGSRTATQMAEARALLAGLINQLENGDRLVLIETYQGGTDSARQWDDSIPMARKAGRPTAGERKKVERFRSSAAMIAATFFDSTRSKQIMTTDILTTIQRSADYASGGKGRKTTLLLLSDMLNATRELNMERAGGIPDSSWIATRKNEGRIPNLLGVCVVAVGGDVASAQGARARAFWRQYFDTAGATLTERSYRNMISDASEVSCS